MSKTSKRSESLRSSTEPLPSLLSLAKATGIALAGAIVLLVLVVLPAEYNLDPTGFGEAIGLTDLTTFASDAAADDVKPEALELGDLPDWREDLVVIEVAPGEGVEYKFSLRAGQKLKYEWEVDQSALYFDFHGEPSGGEKDFFESYIVSTARETRGTLTAPFDGVHGWYWKNKGTTLARVTLVTSGSYEVLGLR
jgi:hypothetical protein